MVDLGRLERVTLRDEWETEDRDFTPWLAREDNLCLLSETVNIELELEAQEKDVGPFRADILCKSLDDDSWVLIENQIERTDHKHLGQLLTYAAGLQAVTIIWIAARFTEEHRATLDWLNKITDESFRFFGLEVELWRINDSLAAPKFNIISKPNNWTKTVSQAAKRIETQNISETKGLQYRYWQELTDYLLEHGSTLRPHTPKPRHWQLFSVGRSGVQICATLNTRDNRLGVELYLSHQDFSKHYFHLLQNDRLAIEQEIGEELDWQEMTDKTASRIAVYMSGDAMDELQWGGQHAWFKTTVERFDSVFRQRVKYLNPDDYENGLEAA